MKALCYHGPRDMRCDSVDDPAIADERDIIVQMTSCGICGSDLHIYHGEGFSEDIGFCVGHEAVGEVVETGRGVQRLKVGDKVMISAAVGCGACAFCLAGHVSRCLNGTMQCYGLSHKLEGCQSEAIRVPVGDFNAALIPEGISIDQALMLTDNVPTAYFACLNADIAPGKTVAVVGLGPIGLMAVEAAFALGAERVFAIDPVAGRREIAAAMGAVVLHPDDALQTITEATGGRMIECVVEAVGADATIRSAIRLAAQEGTVSVIGVNQSRRFEFPMHRAFAMGLTFRIGCCSVQNTWPALIDHIREGRLHPERLISHRMSLREGAEAYRLFDARDQGTLKMVMTP